MEMPSAQPEPSRNSSDGSLTDSNSQETGEVSGDQALAVALENADVPSGQAYNVKVETDSDSGISVYDIEFETDYGDYDFEIAIRGGAIVGADYKVDEEWVYRQPRQEISVEQAKNLVCEKVPGASPAQVEIREESEDGERRYEGQFSYDSLVYEFEMDPATGIIFDWNAELRE